MVESGWPSTSEQHEEGHDVENDASLNCVRIHSADADARVAAQPEREGMNCSDIPWIRGPACSAWKNANDGAQRNWWVRFSEDTGEVHADGRFIGRPLWRLRERLEQLKEEIPLLSYGRNAADRIAFGVMSRVGEEVTSFREPLADALSADADTYDKLFHYEIMAAFAWHGIKLEPGVAIIEPQNFRLDGRPVATGGPAPVLRARGFLGENTVYVAEFSTNPIAFGLLNPHQEPDPADPEFNYIKFTSVDPAAPVPIALNPPSPAITDPAPNFVVDFEIPYDTLELLTHGDDQAVVFMHVTTIGPSGIEASHVEGAGRFVNGAEHPFTIYVATSAPTGGCTCAVIPSRPGLPTGSLALTALTAIALALRRKK